MQSKKKDLFPGIRSFPSTKLLNMFEKNLNDIIVPIMIETNAWREDLL